jgi:hypothetical protein
LLAISPDEATFARRGFREHNKAAREHLEYIGRSFLHGYHSALDDDTIETLVRRLETVQPEYRGFAFEGAAMGLSLLDHLTPWRKDRFKLFLEGPGSAHAYMVHVGVGWALARLPMRVTRTLSGLDNLLRWLAIDGYGFHEGYFHWPRYADGFVIPKRLSGYARRVFDQGLGRSLWFIEGASVKTIITTVSRFSQSRQSDLWSGIGLACAYAGGINAEDLYALRAAAGPFRPQLAQGVAFAAKARQRAHNPVPHTGLASEIICGMSAEESARLTDVALENLAATAEQPEYEVWRCRIQAKFADPQG